MAVYQAQAQAKTAIAAVVKAAPTLIRLGALNTPMPARYANSVGMLVTVRQTGWPSLDGKLFRVSAWQNGGVSTFPDLTLEGSDTTGESGANPPRSDGYIEIPDIPQNINHISWP